HEVAVRVLALIDGAVQKRAQLVRSVGVESALRLELADLVVDVRETLVDARLIDVGDEHRHLQAPKEQQCELAGHEAGTDDAYLADLLRQGLVWCPDRTLRTLLDEIEGVQIGRASCRERV